MSTLTDSEIAIHYNTCCTDCTELINCHGVEVLNCTDGVVSYELVLSTDAIIDCIGRGVGMNET